MCPLQFSVAVPPADSTVSRMPRKIEVAPGKSAFVFSVPCQVMLQPPHCLGTLSAPSPATSTLRLRSSGKRSFEFLSSTSDLRTASRATARCSGAPTSARWSDNGRDDGRPFSNKPARSFTRRMRVTASSMRDSAMSPTFTKVTVFSMNAFHSVGTMKRSIPAFTACAHLSLEQACTSSIPSQSLTTIPSNPSCFLSTSVIR